MSPSLIELYWFLSLTKAHIYLLLTMCQALSQELYLYYLSLFTKLWEPWFADEKPEAHRRQTTPLKTKIDSGGDWLPSQFWLQSLLHSLYPHLMQFGFRLLLFSILLNWLLCSFISRFSSISSKCFHNQLSLINALSKFCVSIYAILFSLISE